MKTRLFILGFLCVYLSFAQVNQETFESYKLDEKRSIQIYTPENYSEDKVYPLMVVLDADFLFDIVVSNVKFYTYLGEMPESIVVGIQQGYNQKIDDCDFSDKDGLPKDKGNAFFEFIGQELVPYMSQKYNLANFKAIIGHDITANFTNYYLFKEQPLFDAYINLSPSFAPLMEGRIPERLASFNDKKFYYLATSKEDEKDNYKRINTLNEGLSKVTNENFHYYFDNFEGGSHTSVASYGIPRALDQIFDIYKPITPKEYRSKMLTLETSIYDYLEEKYNNIETLFGYKKQVSLNDIMAAYSGIKKKEDLPSLLKLAKLSIKEYPETMLGFYFQAEYYEESGEPKKALRAYEKAFGMSEIDFLTKDMAIDKIDALKADFGW
ncbi:esterase [Flavobacteriaceae bacterium R38]|nr:esterase [Flavobacteriaceae bacterium R38]